MDETPADAGSLSMPSFAEPYYLILFKSSGSPDSYRIVIDYSKYAASGVALPYGLDRELAVALPAMWYCLHLPRTRFDFIDIPAKTLKDFQILDLPHHIIFLPVPWPEPLPMFYPSGWPVIILTPEALRPEAEQLASLLPSVVEITDTVALDVVSLQRHWSALYKALRLDRPRYTWPDRILSESSQRALLLPNLFLVRQLRGGRDENAPDAGATKAAAMDYAAQCQVVLSATARLESGGVPPPEAEGIFPQTILRERSNYQCPVALLLPGVSPNASRSKVAGQLADKKLDGSADVSAENKDALEFLVAHRAAARQGVSANASSVSNEAFQILATLERMFDGQRVSPRKVKKYLGQLSREVLAGLTAEEQSALLHASSITSFSEFPVGLVTIPPDTSPLCCRTPIAYRPIVPLTRALQLEMNAVPVTYLRDNLSIICLECIPSEQLVGRLSRAGWKLASEQLLREHGNVAFDFVEVDSIASMRAALHANRYHIAVISAHGVYDRQANRTGFQVGKKDVIVEEDLGHVPPLICLAACQVAPRGAGSINITDVLFRQGAQAVLGTLVPIDVRRNAHLMVRFFTYIAETLDGKTPLRSIDEVWQFTAMSNALLDVTLGSRNASRWMLKSKGGRSGIEEFMLRRSIGRLRKGHIYADTETVMLEMAAELGEEAAFKSWLTNQGYVPESIFYVFLGWPERFIVRDNQFEEARSWYTETWPIT